ncbi:MAG: single-stranded-DNA-specific exonuclease RecJ [Actinomycetota bacterium]
MGQPARSYVAEPYSYSEARALVEGLEVSEPVAITLVRRGYRSVEQARRFLEGGETHDPGEFEAMDVAVERVLAAARGGHHITVHGDYDADGVCATAVLVGALRELGAVCDWYLPDRLADGYGLTADGVDRLTARGTELLITVDCGISCAPEVEAAKGAGMEVIVTDHHSPPQQLPDCPVLHPGVSGYPFEGLCGTGVAHKLAAALRKAAGLPAEASEADLDLVALATVADIVPLVEENRSLVRRGLAVARRGRRPGLRALCAVAGSELASLDEGDFAFRLAPRVNAAGRLYRADAGVELFLTDDWERAAAIATELDSANRERRSAEREVDAAAEAARRELPEELRDAPALVIAGRGWHPGVVGIVASRLVERHWRPVLLISIDEHGHGRGSGRSIPGFDLLAGLEACSQHLGRFGGHRAAAGLELEASELPAFREAFVAHAAQHLGPEQLTRTERIDALVGGDGLGLELAEELERLGPFGAGNPGVRLLVPSARLGDVQPMGEGKHARFSLRSGGSRAVGVAFGISKLPVSDDEPVDAAVRLEVNQWNGAVEPRLVLRDLYPVGDLDEEAATADAHRCRCESVEWWRRFEAELAQPLEPWPADTLREAGQAGAPRRPVHGVGSPIATLAELVSSGESVLALCSDASRRAELAAGATGLTRFAGGSGGVACGRCGASAIRALAGRGGGLSLADYDALSLAPELVLDFEHVVWVDPPPFPHLAALATRGLEDRASFVHSAWGEEERAFAMRVLEEQLGLRTALAAVFRALRDIPAAEGGALRTALAGSQARPRAPEVAARCVRVLSEAGVLSLESAGRERRLRVVSSEGTELERSGAFRAYGARHEEGQRYLASLKQV